MNEFDKRSWVVDARKLLDESTDALDAATLSRLNRARQAALAQRQRRTARAWWLPAAGLAVSCGLLLAVVAWYPHVRPALPLASEHAAAPEADVAAADDGIEFYQDLEFYAWLDAQEQETDG